MAVLKPNSRGELLQINGVGEQKAKQFGDVFLSAIKASEDRSKMRIESSGKQP
jgi:superfamily II DNA helicase RecQ